METIIEYILKVQKSLSYQLPKIAWEASQKSHKRKEKICASRDSSINEEFLQRQCIMTWENFGGSRFTL